MRVRELTIRALLLGCALVSVLTTAGIIYVLVTEALIAIPPEKAFF